MQSFQDRLDAFRGRVESLTFLYRVPGFAGDDRIYLIRRGRIQRDYVYPQSKRDRNRVSRAVEEVYRSVDRGPAALRPQEVAEILLLARWFELRPKELKRTLTPKQ